MHIKGGKESWAYRHTSAIIAPKRPRQEEAHKFTDSLAYRANLVSKWGKKKKESGMHGAGNTA